MYEMSSVDYRPDAYDYLRWLMLTAGISAEALGWLMPYKQGALSLAGRGEVFAPQSPAKSSRVAV